MAAAGPRDLHRPGGAIVAWEEVSFIVAQRVRATGVLDPTFPPNSRFVRLTHDFEHTPDLVGTGGGNAIVAWSNLIPNADADIYAALVVTEGTVGVDPPGAPQGVTFSSPAPNPARQSAALRFALPRATSIRLGIYDAAGRRVREIESGLQPAGDHAISWDLRDEAGRAVVPGLYFARLDADGRTFTQKLVTVNSGTR
ncbi:MAG: FlgD immunoglobulin-like domain containing protein [Candidatus Eiseniibacteriota bacterium]